MCRGQGSSILFAVGQKIGLTTSWSGWHPLTSEQGSTFLSSVHFLLLIGRSFLRWVWYYKQLWFPGVLSKGLKAQSEEVLYTLWPQSHPIMQSFLIYFNMITRNTEWSLALSSHGKWWQKCQHWNRWPKVKECSCKHLKIWLMPHTLS